MQATKTQHSIYSIHLQIQSQLDHYHLKQLGYLVRANRIQTCDRTGTGVSREDMIGIETILRHLTNAISDT